MKQSLLFTIFALVCSIVIASNFHVPGDYASIQAALNACVAGDSVLVAPGVYYENLVWPQIDGISLCGTGSRDNTIIDASAQGRALGFLGDWQNPVITADTYVANLTFRNGYGNLNGAGIYCGYSSPTISNCIITRNQTSGPYVGSGGGFYCYFSSPQLNNVIIAKNSGYSGGGVHIDPSSSPVFNNCIIADNTLSSPGGSYAAGVYCRYEVYPQFTNCTITRNRSYLNAAIHLGEVSNPTIAFSTITDNDEGIRLVSDATAMLIHSSICGNSVTGINNLSSGTVSAFNNWWGSDSGPTAVNNPGGIGDAVIGAVNYSPWLMAPDADCPPVPPLGVSIGNLGEHSLTIEWLANPEGDIDHYVVNYGTDSLLVIQPHNQTSNGLSATISGLMSGTRYCFQVKAVKSSGMEGWYSRTIMVTTSGTSVYDPLAPTAPLIISSYPNPFRDVASIHCRLTGSTPAKLKIFNLKGQLVHNSMLSATVTGEQQYSWDGTGINGTKLPAGIYLLELEQNSLRSHAKLILAK
jgi:hypothetical protein